MLENDYMSWNFNLLKCCWQTNEKNALLNWNWYLKFFVESTVGKVTTLKCVSLINFMSLLNSFKKFCQLQNFYYSILQSFNYNFPFVLRFQKSRFDWSSLVTYGRGLLPIWSKSFDYLLKSSRKCGLLVNVIIFWSIWRS